mgnify:CR=1 FL=1
MVNNTMAGTVNKKITNMQITKTTYDTLPGQIDYLIQEVSEIKNVLMVRIEKPEEIPKFMNKEQALKYIRKQGYEICSVKLLQDVGKGIRYPATGQGVNCIFLPKN